MFRNIAAIIVIALTIIINACNIKQDNINGLKLTEDFCECSIENLYPDRKLFIDCDHKFSIELPKDWMFIENLIDTVKGVVASDTTINFYKNGIVGICEYHTHFTSLLDYFTAEVKNHDSDNEYNIVEIGKININGLESFWTLYEAVNDEFGNHKSIIYYVQRNKSDTFYLLETTIYESENYKEKFCQLRSIIETFKIITEPNKQKQTNVVS